MREHQQQLRDRFLAAQVMPTPEPWLALPTPHKYIPVGGLLGVGFAQRRRHPHGRLPRRPRPVRSGQRARRPPAIANPIRTSVFRPGRTCPAPGFGPLADTRVRIAGLFGGGLHTTTEDGWTVDIVAPDWPDERAMLSINGDIYRGTVGTHWWPIVDSNYSELRAAGFSASGRTLVVATSSDITLWHRS
ncbi:hypothetical protein ACQEUV_17225 [Micromonospora aurantiaca (nom. illeg.)]|uniref:hypothetical protein n=1 Tax=Micromonospora aurantiaca (nom. illeg.) TaxID=47850 RepID=UPI003DA2E31D